jgi:hypothetical protein
VRWVYWVWSAVVATISLTALDKLHDTGNNLYGGVFIFLGIQAIQCYADSMYEFERKEDKK